MAAGDIRFKRGTPLTWGPSGTGATNLLTLTSLTNANGRQGAEVDLGDGAPWLYEWSLETRFNATVTVGSLVDVFILGSLASSSTTPDEALGSGDATFTNVELLRNLKYSLGSLQASIATSGTYQNRKGEVVIYSRYIQPVIWNRSGVTLSATASHHRFTLTPIQMYQVQA
jgi:hypothetical protein